MVEIFSAENFFRTGIAVAALYSGIQANLAHRKSDKTKEDMEVAKRATIQAQTEIHETKVAVTGNGDISGLKRMLELHISANDMRLAAYRSVLDEAMVRLGHMEESAGQRSEKLAEIATEVAKIHVLIGKLDHSSNRHSEQINMLLETALSIRNNPK
jgi:hypothetical protein